MIQFQMLLPAVQWRHASFTAVDLRMVMVMFLQDKQGWAPVLWQMGAKILSHMGLRPGGISHHLWY